ncbi:helix-turn-helix domain-containing protein [Acidianus sulfidivorans JP7]|uniref:ArsR family transcriptional regulator n=1 Tax=Acidianus sulfidivorans JP7 TaxID=619593 RepID=A0A2U9ILV2_9CREN|nr:winged helix-turn-helix domain-containing protein [Acidianus sulfidivorans]AWR97028.1 helix-turn-helix domain-containing protein [Acidianus sulfidivorans JP7]
MERISSNSTRKKIYYYLLKQKSPVNIKKIQKDLNISSVSLVYYHIRKLEEEGLVKETDEGYVVEKVVLSEFIRLYNHVIPTSVFWASFFISSLFLMIIFLILNRPLDGEIFGIIIVSITSAIFINDILKKYKDLIA